MPVSRGKKKRPAATRKAVVFPVVGVGASAGGLKAIQEMLSGVGALSNMACAIVLHMMPGRTSYLPELLARNSPVPVREVTNGMPLRPGQIFVVPPGRIMTVGNGRFHLRSRPSARSSKGIVDRFFISLARHNGRDAIGVILSGTGSDGTAGLTAIKAAGGLTLAQALKTADHPGMPESAIQAGVVDKVLSPKLMLPEIKRRLRMRDTAIAPTVANGCAQKDAAEIDRILAIIHRSTGEDFTNYKLATIRRRIMRRAGLHRLDSLAEYTALLEREPAEALALGQDLLIRVTSFFRDPDAFEILKKKVFPLLEKNRPPDTPIRIWVPGCSTGEEVYSIIIALVETLGRRANKIPLQVFATDRSETAIEIARVGAYQKQNIKEHVSARRLKSFFIRTPTGYQISKPIRDLCIFARHDLTRDPPFSRMDLISCRNVLIYLEAGLQKQIIPMLHYALNPGGFLMLGGSERIITHPTHFTAIDRKSRIYARKTSSTLARLDFPVHSIPAGKIAPRRRKLDGAQIEMEVDKNADRLILSRFSAPSVLVNEDLEILRFRGDTSPFLQPAPGKAQFSLLKMIDGSLLFELREALKKARKRRRAVQTAAVEMDHLGRTGRVTIHVLPIVVSETKAGFFLVVFESLPSADAAGRSKTPRQAARDEQRLVAQLRREVAAARENLHVVLEEQDSMREEFKAANEEILSSNEEMQSTNEELETAKEGLQSANEEMTTVNEELQTRNSQLVESHHDISNLTTSVDVPIVMLRSDMKIRWFTPKSEEVLGLAAADIGKHLSKTRIAKDLPGIEEHIVEVLRRRRVYHQDVQDRNGYWYRLRIHPYQTGETSVEGAVIVLFGINELMRTMRDLEQLREYSDVMAETVNQPVLLLDPKLQVKSVNRAFFHAFGHKNRKIIGRKITDLPGLEIAELKDLLMRSVKHLSGFENVEIHYRSDKGDERILLVSGKWITPERDLTALILLGIADVTDRHRVEEHERMLAEERAARAVAENAVKSREEFLSMVSHEFSTPLAALQMQVDGLHRLCKTQGIECMTAEVLDKSLRLISRQEKRLERLVDGLLDLARIRAGKLKVKSETFDLAHLVRQFPEQLEAELEKSGSTLVIHADQPVIGRWDQLLLERAVANLLANAIHYGAGRPITITVTAKDGTARLVVRDEGIGIKPELRERIFQPFERFSRVSHYGGLGLGLFIVNRIVEAHDGSISVESRGDGRGTAFTINLPMG